MLKIGNEKNLKTTKKEELHKKSLHFSYIAYLVSCFFPSLGIGLTHRWKRTEGRNCAKGTPPFEINFSWNAMTVEASKDLFIYKQSDLLIDNVLHS